MFDETLPLKCAQVKHNIFPFLYISTYVVICSKGMSILSEKQAVFTTQTTRTQFFFYHILHYKTMRCLLFKYTLQIGSCYVCVHYNLQQPISYPEFGFPCTVLINPIRLLKSLTYSLCCSSSQKYQISRKNQSST